MRNAPLSLLAVVFTLVLSACARDVGMVDGGYRPSSRVRYYLNRDANDMTEVVVRSTFERWGEATRFKFEYGGRARAGLRRDGKNTVSFLVRWPKDVPIGKVAYTRNWYGRGGRILESDVIFNMAIARFTTLKTKKPGSYYIEGVLAHEIGHMLGLEHIDDPDSLMFHGTDPECSYSQGRLDAATLAAYRALYSDPGE